MKVLMLPFAIVIISYLALDYLPRATMTDDDCAPVELATLNVAVMRCPD